jgi:hypothetical protein
MTTFTELVATVVVHSSAVALSHFGVTMEPTPAERAAPAAERVIARTPQPHRAVRVTACPDKGRRAQLLKA